MNEDNHVAYKLENRINIIYSFIDVVRMHMYLSDLQNKRKNKFIFYMDISPNT
jgi:hypothetical protein